MQKVTIYLYINRWGQTPLSEAILFKHTKIASVLKRHDRMLKTLNSGNGDTEDVGEALWRKLVQGKLMKTPKAKPIFKFDPSLVESNDKKQKKSDTEIDVAALQKALDERTHNRNRTGSMASSSGLLDIVNENESEGTSPRPASPTPDPDLENAVRFLMYTIFFAPK